MRRQLLFIIYMIYIYISAVKVNALTQTHFNGTHFINASFFLSFKKMYVPVTLNVYTKCK